MMTNYSDVCTRIVQSSLHIESATARRQEILAGALAPGGLIDEIALCERLKILCTPLREALKLVHEQKARFAA